MSTWGKHGQGQGCGGSEVGVRLAHLDDSQEAVIREGSGREDESNKG